METTKPGEKVPEEEEGGEAGSKEEMVHGDLPKNIWTRAKVCKFYNLARAVLYLVSL